MIEWGCQLCFTTTTNKALCYEAASLDLCCEPGGTLVTEGKKVPCLQTPPHPQAILLVGHLHCRQPPLDSCSHTPLVILYRALPAHSYL